MSFVYCLSVGSCPPTVLPLHRLITTELASQVSNMMSGLDWESRAWLNFFLSSQPPASDGRDSFLKQMCETVQSWLWRVACGFSHTEEQKGCLSVAREHVYSVQYMYIEHLYFPCCFRSGILHKLKINGHQHGFSAVVWVHSAFFRMVFSFGTIS